MQHTKLTPEPTRDNAPPDDLIDLRGLFVGLWRGRWIIAGCVAVALAAAAAWIATTQPVYYASALVMIERDTDGIVDLRQAPDNRPLNESVVQSHIRVIRSNRLLGDIVDSLELQDDPAFNSAAAGEPSPGALARLVSASRSFSKGLFGSGGDGNDGDAGGDAGAVAPPDGRRIALETLRHRLDVRQVGVSYAIEVGTTAANADKAAAIANAVVDGYVALRRADKVNSSTEATRLLANQIADLEAQVQESADTVESFQMSSGLADEKRREALSGQLARLRESRAEARDRIGQLEEEIARAEAASTTAESASQGGAAGDIEALKDELRSLEARERSLAKSIADVEARLTEIVRAESRLQQLERQASADRLIYERMLEKMKEINALENLQRADARVIDRAMPPLEPSGPNKKLAVALALAGGGGLGLAILALTELLRNSFRTREELETFTEIPVIGCLPFVRRISNPSRMLDRLQKGREPELAEAMRELCLGLFRVRARQSGQAIMVSSACPGEGKTTATLLLADMTMVFGRRAIVVDCDMRRSRLASALKLPERHSLNDVLFGETAWADAVQVTRRHGVHVLGPWSGATSSPDAFDSPEFGALLEALRNAYDLVLIDTPPLGPAADGVAIAGHVDAVFTVVAWNTTHRAAVEDGLLRLQRHHMQVEGMILSKVDLRQEARYRAVPYRRYRRYQARSNRRSAA